MSFSISKDSIDHLLFEVAKEYKKIARKYAEPINMIIVGGGSILLLHNFRSISDDIDSIVYGNSVFDEAIKNVANRNGLPYDWINSDFVCTSSYSKNLPLVAKTYKKYCNILTVSIVDDEYLVAMKLASFRSYKHDKSDIIGILKDMYDENKNIDIITFVNAYNRLYNATIPNERYTFLCEQLNNNKFLDSFDLIQNEEKYYKTKIEERKDEIRNSVDLQKAINEIKETLKNTTN